MVDDCPSPEVLATLLAEAPGRADADPLEAHVGRCAECQRRLDDLTSDPAVARLAAAPENHEDWTRTRSSSISQQIAVALSGEMTALRTAQPDEPSPEIEGYDILARIGSGGSADVYRAFHRQLRRVVALKISRVRASAEDFDRFRREAEALARLRHPGVIRIYETGQAGGRLFMALEYEPGGSLSKYLQGKPQPPLDAARFIALAAQAIHEAHLAGLVHRDVKPGNILLHATVDGVGREGLARFSPLLTDFGLVKSLTDESALTRSRDVLGTPSYMAPEQVAGQGAAVGPAADVYSLGAVLYELLTGRPPFQAATAIDTVVQVRFDDPLPPSRLTRTIPKDLETICLKCLEKDPSHRYAGANALAEDLARFVDGQTVQARPLRWPVRAGRWIRRNPRVAALSAVILSLLTALAVAGPLVALRQSALRRNAEMAEAKALAQRDRADRNVQAAGYAIWETTLQKLVDADGGAAPLTAAERRQLIANAIPYLEQAQSHDPDLPLYRERWGIALFLRGRAAAGAGDPAAAGKDLQDAAAALDRLCADIPENPVTRYFAACCQVELARLARPRSPDDAERLSRDALRRFEDLVRRPDAIPISWDGLAEAATLLAEIVEAQPARTTEALTPLARAVEARAHLASRTALPRTVEQEIQARIRLAALQRMLRQLDAAQAGLKHALAIANRKPPAGAPSLELALLRSGAVRLLAEVHCDRADWPEAARLAADAEQQADRLVLSFPGMPALERNRDQCRAVVERAQKKMP